MRRMPLGAALFALTVTSCVSLPTEEVGTPSGSDEARAGGVVKIGILQPRSLDPADASDPASQLVVRTMCDTLLLTDAVSGELVPGISDEWTPNADNGATRILLSLREDVYFPDGTQVDARTVVDSLSRLAREETAGSMATLLRDVQGYDHIRGETEDPPDRSTEYLTGIRVSDPFGLEIVVPQLADAGWVRRLAHAATAIVDDEAARADPLAFARQPVCAGPYQLAAPWNPGDPIIRLVRNEHYHGSPAGYTADGAGYADEILFYTFATAEEANQAYVDGWVDIVQPLPAERAAASEAQPDDYVTGNDPLMMYVGLPWQPGNLFEDPEVRLALSRALDRQAIADSAYAGGAVPATGFLPPLVGPAHREDACPDELPTEPVTEPAPSAVDGQTVPLYFYDGYPANAVVADHVVAAWAVYGLAVEPTPLPEEDFLAMAEGGFDGPFLMGWDGDRMGTPEEYLQSLVVTGARANVGRFSDPVLDRYLIEDVTPFGGRAGPGLDVEEEQLIALERAEQRVCELMPVIPVVSMRSHWLVRTERLGSARESVLDRFGDPALREVWVKPQPTEEATTDAPTTDG